MSARRKLLVTRWLEGTEREGRRMWKKYAFTAVRNRPPKLELPTAERRLALMRRLEQLIEAAQQEGATKAEVKDDLAKEDKESS
jgi:hypothetical protein